MSRRVLSDTQQRTLGAANEDDHTENVPSMDEFLKLLESSSRPSSGTFTLMDAERRRTGGSTGSREWLTSVVASHQSDLPPNQLREASRDSARERISSSDLLSFLDIFFTSPRAATSSSSESEVSTTELQPKAAEGEEEPTLTPEDETEDKSEPSSTEPTVPAPEESEVTNTRTTSPRTPSTTTASHGYVKVQTWDFLSERGGRGNNHIGNKRVHKLLSQLKESYREIETKQGKTQFVHSIVAYVKSYGGRFLKKDTSRSYVEMTSAQARIKASQCIRENKQLKWTAVDIEDEDDAFMEFYRVYIA